MGIAEIVALVTAILGALSALPKIFSWFRTPPTDKEDKVVDEVRRKVDKARETGRPEW